MLRKGLLACVALTLAGGASAHGGHDASGFMAGLMHPLSGADHLLAMLSVGLWAAVALPAGRRGLAPLLFVGLMALGALQARLGWLQPVGLELLIAASVLLLGALLVGGPRIAARWGLPLIGAAAALHGAAHGLEMDPAASALAYGGGFLLATALLHGTGLALGARWLRHSQLLRRAVGAAVGLGGASMLLVRI
jgi:urease accessory protein